MMLIVFLLTGERCGQARFSKRRSSDRIGCDGAITPEVLRRNQLDDGIGDTFVLGPVE
jgi:hypothetical protein